MPLSDKLQAKISRLETVEALATEVQRENGRLKVEVARLRALVEPMQPILDELARAEQKFPKWPTDPVHAAAVVAEEAGELVQAALQHTYERDCWSEMVKEAVQTGAMALRFLIWSPEMERRASPQKARAALAPPEPGA